MLFFVVVVVVVDNEIDGTRVHPLRRVLCLGQIQNTRLYCQQLT